MSRSTRSAAIAEREPITEEQHIQENTSREQQRECVRRICVKYPRWNEITDEIAYIHAQAEFPSEPLGLLLTGLTGMGKTTLTRLYAGKYRPHRVGGVMKRPVVCGTVPSRATDRSLASALLRGMKDPRADKGTTTSMTFRLTDYLREGETRLLMLDEIQHFDDCANQLVLEHVSNWLKNLIKDEDLKIAVVLIGLKTQADMLLGANHGQLAAFFGDTYTLDPLVWGHPDNIEQNEFWVFMAELDSKLPFDQSEPHLAVEDIAYRCWVASQGIIRPLMRLVRRAAYIAIDTGSPCITKGDLEVAFDKELAGKRRGIPNPFKGDDRPEPPPSPEPDTAPVPAGTNNRGGRGKGRQAANAIDRLVKQVL